VSRRFEGGTRRNLCHCGGAHQDDKTESLPIQDGVPVFSGQNHAEIDTIPYPQKCRKSAVSGRFFYFQHCGGIGKMAVLTRRFTILVVLCNDRKAIVTE